MKKICQFICVCAVVVFFVGASVWEGAAAASQGTELPETGLFMATNSFPGNTVVDVTNLENGKTIQVIVSSGLDTPGLLAVLSRDAAGAIGLPERSIGRIRMTQPADTIAFSRFAEGLGSSGDPDYDPAAFTAMNGYDPSAAENAVVNEGEVPGHGRTESGDLIVDMPVEETPPAAVVPAAVPPEASPAPVQAEETEAAETEIAEAPEEIPDAAAVAAGETETAAESEPAPQLADVPEEVPPEAVPFVPVVINDDSIVSEKNPELVEPVSETLAAGETETAAESEYDLAMVPADTRPPEKGPEPDVSYFIPGITPLDEASPDPAPDYIDPSLVIEPVKETPPEMPLLAEDTPLPVEASPAVIPAENYAPAAAALFSVPVISNLEEGKYYLQIAAYSKAETVESEVAKIDSELPVTVMNSGSADKPVYRILIGPVNLGESGALLQRFKNSYKDAFVRLGT